MSCVIPGQNTVDSARETIDVTPWCAEWRTDKTCGRSEVGIKMRCLYKTTPSKVDKWSRA